MSLKMIKVGVIGLGIFGEMETSILKQLPNVEVIALSTKDKKRVEEIGRRFGIKKLFTDYRDLLKEDAIDAVFIVSAAKDHLDQSLDVISSGKHIFLEKPAALSYDDTKKIIDCANNAGIVIMVGHERRFEVGNATVKKYIDEGKFGKLMYMVFKSNISKHYFTEDGGTYSHPVFETMSHDLNLALWFAQSEVERIYAREIYGSSDKRPDACLATITFKNGIVSFFETNWLIPSGAPRNHWKYGGTMDIGYEVVGSKIIAKTNLINSSLSFWDNEKTLAPEKEWWPEANDRIEGSLRNEIIHFIDCISKSKPSHISSIEDVLYEAKLIDNIVKSAKENREIILG